MQGSAQVRHRISSNRAWHQACTHVPQHLEAPRLQMALRRGRRVQIAPVREGAQLVPDVLVARLAEHVHVDLLRAERAPHRRLAAVRERHLARRRLGLAAVDARDVLVGGGAAPELVPLDEEVSPLRLHARRAAVTAGRRKRLSLSKGLRVPMQAFHAEHRAAPRRPDECA
jgi:hypothetical protein